MISDWRLGCEGAKARARGQKEREKGIVSAHPGGGKAGDGLEGYGAIPVFAQSKRGIKMCVGFFISTATQLAPRPSRIVEELSSRIREKHLRKAVGK